MTAPQKRRSARGSHATFGDYDSRTCTICDHPIRISGKHERDSQGCRFYHQGDRHISWHVTCEREHGWPTLAAPGASKPPAPPSDALRVGGPRGETCTLNPTDKELIMRTDTEPEPTTPDPDPQPQPTEPEPDEDLVGEATVEAGVEP